ncbi:VanZ family protein [Microbacterium sp. 179-B 1A2 NHS]|uniref:VanZ family protein n=1 Tax=Microbacterium sp. 179-B 1A2 NHS TaxID=3142383 RepID=UPI0039A157B8
MDRRRRWVWGALAGYAVLVGVVLLSPLSPSVAIDAVTGWIRDDAGLTRVRQGWVEFGGNIVMFVPLGLLLTLAFRVPWRGVALAVVLSVAAELVQLLLPARMPSIRDVIANALGALLGAGIAWLLIRRSRPARPPATRRAR